MAARSPRCADSTDPAPLAGRFIGLIVTTDSFIALASNVCAIRGLRAMCFLLAALAARFHLLSYGLAAILVFIGTKTMLIDVFKVPGAVSPGVVVSVLAPAMWLGPHAAPNRPAEAPAHHE